MSKTFKIGQRVEISTKDGNFQDYGVVYGIAEVTEPDGEVAYLVKARSERYPYPVRAERLAPR